MKPVIPFKLNEIDDPTKAFDQLRQKSSDYWSSLGKSNVSGLAKLMVTSVPAYRDLLRSKNIKVQNNYDSGIATLPVTDKQTYLRTYPYQDLFINGSLDNATTISATSGSSGEPFYFPRTEEGDAQYRYMSEMFLVNQMGLSKTKKTLGIIGFGMGIWIGGVFTYKNFNQIAQKGYNLTLVPTGANIDLFLKSFRKLAEFYDQIIIMGYPPFIKDVVDEGKNYKIDWKKYNIKVITAAEGYSEDYRTYISKNLGLKNPILDTINMYGTVELGTMAMETPLSILIRQATVKNKRLFTKLFPLANRLPTLVQYYPSMIYFEEQDGEVLASGYGSSIPLLRYRFPDRGGVITYDQVQNIFDSCGLDLTKMIKSARITDKYLKLPFVYVYDRSDNALMLRGATIFSDEIKDAMFNKLLAKFVTGKFTMAKNDDSKANSYLTIHVELKRGIRTTGKLVSSIKNLIVATLLKKNDEYHYLHSQAPAKVQPVIILHPYQDKVYFSGLGKQKWAI